MTAHPPRKRLCPVCLRRVKITRSRRFKPHAASPYGARQCTNAGELAPAMPDGLSADVAIVDEAVMGDLTDAYHAHMEKATDELIIGDLTGWRPTGILAVPPAEP